MTGPAVADTWDTRYAGSDYYFGTAPNAFLVARKNEPEAR